MKEFLVVVLVALAVAVSGCASVQPIQLVPTVFVNVVNNCQDSVVHLTLPYGDTVKIPYRGVAKVSLRSYSHLAGIGRSYGNSLMMTARGFGLDGVYLGSASRSFSPGYSGRAPDRDWLIYNLQGGERSCQTTSRRRADKGRGVIPTLSYC